MKWSFLKSPSTLWLGTAAAVLAAVLLWAARVLGSNDAAGLRNVVAPVATVRGMHGCVVAIIAGVVGLAAWLPGLLSRRQAITAAVIVVAGWFTTDLAPRTTRIFFDEHIYMQIGQTLTYTGRAEAANYARVEYGHFEMYDAWVNKQPNGLPYLLSWLYRVFGASVRVGHWLNPALMGMTAAALYLALAIAPWKMPPGAGLASAILFLLTPLVPWWGNTVAVEPAAAATVAGAFLAACLHARLRDGATSQGRVATAVLLGGITALAVYFRPESMLVFPLVAVVLWSSDDHFIMDRAAWGALLLATALIVPNLLHLWSVRTEDWGAGDGRRFAFAFFAKNFSSNAGYFVDGRWFPVAGTLLAVVGVAWLVVRQLWAGVAVMAWFAMSWGIFVFFYAGGYYYGASSRYGIVSCAPVALLMGIGAAALWRRMRRWPLLLGLLGALALVNWVVTFSYVPTLSREASEAVADAAFVTREARELPEGSLVISHDPCMWLMEGVNSGQFFSVDPLIHSNLREIANQYPGGVYVHWGFWHNADPPKAAETARLLAEFGAEEVARTTSQSYKLALFRIDTPAGIARFGGPAPTGQRKDSDLDEHLARAQAALAGGGATSTSSSSTP